MSRSESRSIFDIDAEYRARQIPVLAAKVAQECPKAVAKPGPRQVRDYVSEVRDAIARLNSRGLDPTNLLICQEINAERRPVEVALRRLRIRGEIGNLKRSNSARPRKPRKPRGDRIPDHVTLVRVIEAVRTVLSQGHYPSFGRVALAASIAHWPVRRALGELREAGAIPENPRAPKEGDKTPFDAVIALANLEAYINREGIHA